MPKTYYPLRYLAQGKFPNGFYLFDNILFHDFLVWLALFLPLNHILTIAVCYFQMILLYEVGYYDNDFRAAKKEAAPVRSSTWETFSGYKIRLWSLVWVLGLFPVLVYMPGGPGLQGLWRWACGLISLLVVYYVYNSVSPEKRQPLYFVLQVMKYGLAMLWLPFTGLGAVIMCGAVLCKYISYVVYRSGGDPNRHQKGAFFAGYTLLGLVLLWTSPLEISFGYPFAIWLILIGYNLGRDLWGSKYTVYNVLCHFFPGMRDKV